MINIFRKELTLDNIRELVSEESIWHHLIPNFNRVGRKFKDRDEDDASACIKSINGRLVYSDFGKTSLRKDCVDYIMESRGVTFKEALESIRDDFNLDLGDKSNAPKKARKTTPKIYPKREYPEEPKIIRYRRRKWNHLDTNYWTKKYGFTEADCKLFRIIPADYYWVDDYCFKTKKDSPTYIYPIHNRRKIYTPLDKDYKWFGNTTKLDIMGLHLLKGKKFKLMFYISSYKDTGVMYKAGFYGVPVPSENSFVPEEFHNKVIKKGIKPVILFDNDGAGITNAKIFSEKYNIPYIHMPKVYYKDRLLKDPSDFVEVFGYDILIGTINELLKQI